MLNVRSTYGREARIRSWAFFIFEAETISIALVILRVLCTLLILVVIALELAMSDLLFAADRSTQLSSRQYVPVFLKSSIAADSAFSSSAVCSLVCVILSTMPAYLPFMNWRSADSNASAFSTGTSS